MAEERKFNWHELKTLHGYNLAEVASAMQKAIRRSNVDDAIYWATELHKSGYSKYVWKRLFVILNEDISAAASENQGLWADAWALFQMVEHYNKEAKKNGKQGEVETLGFTNFVIKLAMAKKGREGVHATITHFNMPRDMRPIPDYALDRHTIRGKSLKQNTWDYFFEEASKLMDVGDFEVEPDPYQAGVHKWLNEGQPDKQPEGGSQPDLFGE
jgi:replication-associated recombination protein RarA